MGVVLLLIGCILKLCSQGNVGYLQESADPGRGGVTSPRSNPQMPEHQEYSKYYNNVKVMSCESGTQSLLLPQKTNGKDVQRAHPTPTATSITQLHTQQKPTSSIVLSFLKNIYLFDCVGTWDFSLQYTGSVAPWHVGS